MPICYPSVFFVCIPSSTFCHRPMVLNFPIFVTSVLSDGLFFLNRRVVFFKTTRRFHQNDTLFSPKRYVVFLKTIRCFLQNDTSIDEHKTSIMGRPMQDEYELGSFAEFPKGNSRGSCNIERIHLMRHWDAHHKVSFGNGLWRKAVALGTHDER